MTGEHPRLRLIKKDETIPPPEIEVGPVDVEKNGASDWELMTKKIFTWQRQLDEGKTKEELAGVLVEVYTKMTEFNLAQASTHSLPANDEEVGLYTDGLIALYVKVIEVDKAIGGLPETTKGIAHIEILINRVGIVLYQLSFLDERQELYLDPLDPPKVQEENASRMIAKYTEWSARRSRLNDLFLSKGLQANTKFSTGMDKAIASMLFDLSFVSRNNQSVYHFLLDHYPDFNDNERTEVILGASGVSSAGKADKIGELEAEFKQKTQEHKRMKEIGELLSQARSIQELLYFIDMYIDTATNEVNFQINPVYSKDYLKEGILERVYKTSAEDKSIQDFGFEETLATKKAGERSKFFSVLGEVNEDKTQHEHPLMYKLGDYNFSSFVRSCLYKRMEANYLSRVQNDGKMNLSECTDWVDVMWFVEQTVADEDRFKVVTTGNSGVPEMKFYNGIEIKTYVRNIPYGNFDAEKLPSVNQIIMDKSPDGKLISGLRERAEFLLAA